MQGIFLAPLLVPAAAFWGDGIQLTRLLRIWKFGFFSVSCTIGIIRLEEEKKQSNK
jgi:hypothetical protein